MMFLLSTDTTPIQQSATFWAAIIAAGVSVIAIIVNVCSIQLQNKHFNESTQQQKELAVSERYQNIISANRVQWMQNLKALLAKYYEAVESHYYRDKEPVKENIFELTTMIKLQLNFAGRPDRILVHMIDSINKSCRMDNHYGPAGLGNEQVQWWLKYLILVSQIYLKTEWERVKFDAKNQLNNKFEFDDKFIEFANDENIRMELFVYQDKCENFNIFEKMKENKRLS